MTREITPDFSDAVEQPEVYPLMLVEFFFDEETVRFWSGYGPISFQDNEYTGTGHLGSIGTFTETTNISAQGLTMTLSGIRDEDMEHDTISRALEYDYQDREIKVWFALCTDERVIIANYLAFVGRLDVMTIARDGGSCTISVSAENKLIDLERPRVFRYTSEQQKSEYPTDTGFDRVTLLQDKQILWTAPADD